MSSLSSSVIKSAELTNILSNGQTVYVPPWIRKSSLSNVTRENNSSDDCSIVDTRTNKKSLSWCSLNIDNNNYSDGGFQSKPQQLSSLSSELTSSSTKSSVDGLQQVQNSSNSSKDTSSDDLLYNNALVNKLHNPSVVRKNHPSFNKKNSNIDNSNAVFESFFPERVVTDSVTNCLESRVIKIIIIIKYYLTFILIVLMMLDICFSP